MAKKRKTKHVHTCREWKAPEKGETGYCANCGACAGFHKRSYSYEDIFPSTRQKLAAFRLFRKFDGSENTHENLIYFLCCSGISIDFLKFCARNEGYDDLGLYLEATGCMVSVEELLHDG